MAWEQVKVKGQIETVMGMRKNNLVDIPNILISDTIDINGNVIAAGEFLGLSKSASKNNKGEVR